MPLLYIGWQNLIMPRRPPASDPLAAKKKLLERLGIPWEQAAKVGAENLNLPVAQLRKADLGMRVHILKKFGIPPHMALAPAFFKKPIRQLMDDAARLDMGSPRGSRPARKCVRPAKEYAPHPSLRKTAEEKDRRLRMILDGANANEVLNKAEPDGTPLTWRQRIRVADSAKRRLFEQADGDVEKAVQLMVARGFNELESRRSAETFKSALDRSKKKLEKI
jgi:hypothetical protein